MVDGGAIVPQIVPLLPPLLSVAWRARIRIRPCVPLETLGTRLPGCALCPSVTNLEIVAPCVDGAVGALHSGTGANITARFIGLEMRPTGWQSERHRPLVRSSPSRPFEAASRCSFVEYTLF